MDFKNCYECSKKEQYSLCLFPVRTTSKENFINLVERIICFFNVCSTCCTKTPDKTHVAIQMESSESRPIYIPRHHETTNDLCLFCFPINTVFTLFLCNPSTHFCVKSFRPHSSGSAVFSRHTYKSSALLTQRTSRYKIRRRGARLFVARLHKHRIYSRRLLKEK